MNKIQIGQDERALDKATESWIIQSIQDRKRDGLPVCVQVFLKMDGVDMVLSTPQCGGGGGGGRVPNAKEQGLFDRWNERHMNQEDWSPGDLIAFLKQARLL